MLGGEVHAVDEAEAGVGDVEVDRARRQAEPVVDAHGDRRLEVRAGHGRVDEQADVARLARPPRRAPGAGGVDGVVERQVAPRPNCGARARRRRARAGRWAGGASAGSAPGGARSRTRWSRAARSRSPLRAARRSDTSSWRFRSSGDTPDPSGGQERPAQSPVCRVFLTRHRPGRRTHVPSPRSARMTGWRSSSRDPSGRPSASSGSSPWSTAAPGIWSRALRRSSRRSSGITSTCVEVTARAADQHGGGRAGVNRTVAEGIADLNRRSRPPPRRPRPAGSS